MQCPTCKNIEFNKAGECGYCIWRGTIGPGAQLRQIIKMVRGNAWVPQRFWDRVEVSEDQVPEYKLKGYIDEPQ